MYHSKCIINDWEKTKEYLIRSFFEDYSAPRPSTLTTDDDTSSLTEDLSSAEHQTSHHTSPIVLPRLSPLPDLIIERVDNSRKHDDPEEFYNRLEAKVKKYILAISNGTINDEDLEAISNRTINDEDSEAIFNRTINDEDLEAISNRTINGQDLKASSTRTINDQDSEAISNRTINDEDLEAISNRTINDQDLEASSNRTINDQDSEAISNETINDQESEAISNRTINDQESEGISNRTINDEDLEAISNGIINDQDLEIPADDGVDGDSSKITDSSQELDDDDLTNVSNTDNCIANNLIEDASSSITNEITPHNELNEVYYKNNLTYTVIDDEDDESTPRNDFSKNIIEPDCANLSENEKHASSDHDSDLTYTILIENEDMQSNDNQNDISDVENKFPKENETFDLKEDSIKTLNTSTDSIGNLLRILESPIKNKRSPIIPLTTKPIETQAQNLPKAKEDQSQEEEAYSDNSKENENQEEEKEYSDDLNEEEVMEEEVTENSPQSYWEESEEETNREHGRFRLETILEEPESQISEGGNNASSEWEDISEESPNNGKNEESFDQYPDEPDIMRQTNKNSFRTTKFSLPRNANEELSEQTVLTSTNKHKIHERNISNITSVSESSFEEGVENIIEEETENQIDFVTSTPKSSNANEELVNERKRLSPIYLDKSCQCVTDIPNKRQKVAAASSNQNVTLSKQINWENLRKDFFIGVPKVYNICKCTDHVCT